MDASCTIQDSIHVFSLVHKYVSSILGTYQKELFKGFDYKKYWAEWNQEHSGESKEINWGESVGREKF